MGQSRGYWAFLSLVVVWGASGCMKPSARPITLAKFGGAVKLRLKLQKGDTYTFRTRAETKTDIESSRRKVEVVLAKPKEIRTLLTVLKYQNEGDDPFGFKSQVAERMRGLRIEGIYDEYAATRLLTAVSNDEEVIQSVGFAQALSPGLQGIVFPEEPVKFGSQWHVNLDISVLTEMLGGDANFGEQGAEAPVTFTFRSAEEEPARTVFLIDYTINSRFELDNLLTKIIAAMRSSGDAKATFEIKGKGTMRLDSATGLVVRDENNMVVRMSLAGETQSQKVKSTTELEEFGRNGILIKTQ